jgi:O-antigen/teichoic acid export membrane protein
MKPGLTQHALTGMIWVAFGSGALAVLKLVALVVLTRLLSPADFGLMSAALVIVTFSINFAQLGLGPALVQRPRLEPRHISTAFVASIAFGMLTAAIIWWGAPLIGQFFHMDGLVPVVRALAFAFPVAGIAIVPESLLQRELRFRLLANREILSYGLGYGLVGVVLALLGWGVWSLVFAQLAQGILRAGFLLWIAPPGLRSAPTWMSFRELLGFGVGQSAARVGVILANQADSLVVGRWLGAVALGFYSRAYQLMAVPTSLLGDVLDRVLFPAMAKVQDDHQRLRPAYLQGTASVALLSLPLSAVAAILAPELIAVVFGSRWLELVGPFQILVLGVMFRTGYRVSDSLARATGRVYRRAWRQALFAALVFLGALIGQEWGLNGVALGVLGAYFINYLMMAQLSLSIVNLRWPQFLGAQLPAVRLAILVGAAAFALVFVARHLIAAHPLVVLAAGLLGAAGTAALAVWLAPSFTLGEFGLRTRDTLRAYLSTRMHAMRVQQPGR